MRFILLPFITLALISLSILFLSTVTIDNIMGFIYKVFPLPVFPGPRTSDMMDLIYNLEPFIYVITYIYLILFGIINVILIIPIALRGVTLPNKTQSKGNIKYDERSGDKSGEIPKEIQLWNWGSASFSYIWAMSHGLWAVLWSVLLIPIPVINIFVLIIFGLKGNQWAWRAQRWESVEQFTEEQSKWKNPFGLFVFILLLIYFSFYAFAFVYTEY